MTVYWQIRSAHESGDPEQVRALTRKLRWGRLRLSRDRVLRLVQAELGPDGARQWVATLAARREDA